MYRPVGLGRARVRIVRGNAKLIEGPADRTRAVQLGRSCLLQLNERCSLLGHNDFAKLG